MNLVWLGLGVGLFCAIFITFIVIMIRRSQSQTTPSPAPAPTPSAAPGPGSAPAPGARQTTTITDCGYASKTRGWYDVSGTGSKNDFCRWVGNSEADSHFSCALAGSTNQYSTPGQFTDDTLAHDALAIGDTCFQGVCSSGYYQSAPTVPASIITCPLGNSCAGGPWTDTQCNCICLAKPS